MIRMAVLAAVIIANDFYKLLAGKLAEEELVGIVESEEDPDAAEAAARRATEEAAKEPAR